MDIQSIISNTRLVTLEETTSKLEKAYRKFNQIRTKFPPTSSLSDKERQLLHILESRSEANHGDTKISNTKLCLLLEKSRATVDRYLAKLEKLGYICRLCIPYKSLRSFCFYTNRTFRCRRIILKYRFAFKRDLGWKQDCRPDFDVYNAVDESTGGLVDFRWILSSGVKILTDTGQEIRSMWNWVVDLFDLGILDPEQQSWFDDLKEKIEIDREHPVASIIMGMKFKFGED